MNKLEIKRLKAAKRRAAIKTELCDLAIKIANEHYSTRNMGDRPNGWIVDEDTMHQLRLLAGELKRV
jgi:hypothetical protein